jgi:LPXTG-motif cell wall-anchored protein
MQLNYPPNDLLPDAESPFIAYYDSNSNAWIRLAYATSGQVAEADGEVNGLTQQLSLFTVLVKVPANPYEVPVNLPGVSSVDWRLIVGIVGGALLALGLVLFYRRRRKRLATGS